MNIAQTLNDYLNTLQNRGLSAALNPAASLEEIKNFENEHGIHLPDIFIKLYQKFNGQMNELIPPSEPRWLGLEEIFSKQQDWQEFCQTHYGKQWKNLNLNSFDGQGYVKNKLFHPFWLPFMADEGGFYCLDYDPDHKGQIAQVIYAHLQTTLEKTNIVHLADNFGIWFENHVQAFQARRTAVTLNTLLDEYLILQKNNPMLLLNPPADISDILLKETFLMLEFPRNLVRIWSEFNGYQAPNPVDGDYWIPLNKIETIQQQWREQLEKRLDSDPEKTIRPHSDDIPNIHPYYYNPLWIPIYQNQTILVVLDFDPAEGGTYGQPLIIYNQFEYSISSEVDSFDEWLYRFLNYYLYPEEESGNLANSDFSSLKLITHYEHYLGIPDNGFGIEGYPYELHLLWFTNIGQLQTSALVTCGNSQKIFKDRDNSDYGIEIIMFLPENHEKNSILNSQQWALNLLAMASQALQNNLFQKRPEEICLIPNGDPMEYLEGTNFSGFALIQQNYIFPQEFYQFKNSENETINIVLLIPLYKEEIEFIIKNDTYNLLDYIKNYDISSLADIKRALILSDLE